MPRLAAFLGSFNIGGNRVKMVDLKAELAKRGMGAVQTVAASGNLIFTDERGAAEIERQLTRTIEQRFGFKSCAMVRTREEVEAAIEGNPFHGTGPEHGSDRMVHSIFLNAMPEQSLFDAMLEEHRRKGGERLALGDRVIFLDYVHGVGLSDVSNKFLERRLGCKGTARNMNSLKNILSKMH